MSSLLWAFRTQDSFTLAWPICLSLAICLLIGQTDILMLLGAWFAKRALNRHDSFRRSGKNERPTGLVIIPSLLRNDEDLNAFTTTVESCGTNNYPSELVIIACVDGLTEQPGLVARLRSWVAAQSYPENVHVYVAGTPTRLGKMMAVESGVSFMHDLVKAGKHEKFPEIYFSIDGDGTLGEDALERMAARLTTRHPITGNYRRIVSGKICIRPDLFWRGWKAFFTVEGQIFIQVAREFVVSNMTRYNWKWHPVIGVPGALYCTWGEIICQAPHYMGFMKQIRFKDWLGWWAGKEPPKFSTSNAPSLPEALTGASDDTCIAFIASIASWKNGKLSFDAPRTPLHAVGRFFISFFVERSHDYEPEARVFTYTPSSVKGLWKQRVRWNASRFECAGRFWRSFWFHWEIGLPVTLHLSIVIQTVLGMTTYYVLLPYYCFKQGNALTAYVIGYICQTVAYSIYTVIGLLLEREYKNFWRVLLCLPLAAPYCIVINFFGCVTGVTKDLLLFGNTTNFAPEWTMAKGGCTRVALLFRARRFFALSLRSVIYGDVPLGMFWVGWGETQWTPNGFEGWTTGKAQRAVLPLPTFASLRRKAVSAATVATPAPVEVAAETALVPAEAAPAMAELALAPAAATPLMTAANLAAANLSLAPKTAKTAAPRRLSVVPALSGKNGGEPRPSLPPPGLHHAA